MYQVNVSKIEETLLFLEETLHSIQPLIKENKVTDNPVYCLALERALHIAIESIADVGNHLIDGFIMRDPGSYEDIVEILRDENVISDAMSQSLKGVVTFRRDLITHFISIDDAKVFWLLYDSYAMLNQFPVCVREYLKNEL
ncbi:DUF86 domain-containing protein [Aneurinibacillus terranovensis]|uniref:DUF86 domain-containing protein n=1 Tax=Aneurinibacillus terranovensis TaxID=278991 RepID=UPI00041933B3|nr:DUF86 domain-containing protein [Aneurinibacillus terranovensis]